MKILTQFLIIFLCACSVSRNFRGNDNPGNKSATFDEFNGKQAYTFSLPDKKPFWLKYSVNLKSGTIHLKINSATTKIADKEITSTASDSLMVNNNEGEYKISFNGKHASGSYEVSYSQLN